LIFWPCLPWLPPLPGSHTWTANINEIVVTISTAVREQSVATEEIVANLAQASMSLGEGNEYVNQNSAVSGSIGQGIASVNEISLSSFQVKSSG